MLTFEECHQKNMTAIQAAKATGKTRQAAYRWAARNRVQWTRDDDRSAIKVMMRAARRDIGMPEAESDPEAIRRSRFWLRCNKTGETFKANTPGQIYYLVNIRGLTDWDYGRTSEAAE